MARRFPSRPCILPRWYWAHDGKVTTLFRRAAYLHITHSPFLRPLAGLRSRLLDRQIPTRSRNSLPTLILAFTCPRDDRVWSNVRM